jgi:hypothetical protein
MVEELDLQRHGGGSPTVDETLVVFAHPSKFGLVAITLSTPLSFGRNKNCVEVQRVQNVMTSVGFWQEQHEINVFSL